MLKGCLKIQNLRKTRRKNSPALTLVHLCTIKYPKDYSVVGWVSFLTMIAVHNAVINRGTKPNISLQSVFVGFRSWDIPQFHAYFATERNPTYGLRIEFGHAFVLRGTQKRVELARS